MSAPKPATPLHPDPMGALLRAARWAETHHKPDGDMWAPTWTVLYQLAAEAEAGTIDVSDMPTLSTPWSDVLIYLERVKGIDVIARAYEISGKSPMFQIVGIAVL